MSVYEYRRQFILGKKEVKKNDIYWDHIELKENFVLSYHKDLEVTQIIEDKRTLVCLGFMIDHNHPDMLNKEVLKLLNNTSTTFEDFCDNTKSLSGKWIIIFVQESQIVVFNDPLGLKSIYYYDDGTSIWCASQDSLLADLLQIDIDKDPDKVKYYNSFDFKRSNHFWIGDNSKYYGVKHLLPNHSLDIIGKRINRFWPNKVSITLDEEYVIERISYILKNCFLGISQRYNVILPVTAGLDSRMALAASRQNKDDIYYYIYQHKHMSEESSDIIVPKRLFKELKLEFHIEKYNEIIPVEFENHYMNNLTWSRRNYFINMAYDKEIKFPNSINIDTYGNEIVRNFYRFYPLEISSKNIAKIAGFPKYRYVEREIESWLSDSSWIISSFNYNLFDIFYWEQRMGNWGSLAYSENEISIEDYSMFNNREYIELLLAIDADRRNSDQSIFHDIIKNLWDEVMLVPISPLSFKAKVKKKIEDFLKRTNLVYEAKAISSIMKR